MFSVVGPPPGTAENFPSWWLWWNVAMLVALFALGVWAFVVVGGVRGPHSSDEDEPEH